MITAVFDCMVFVQAALSRRGIGAACLVLCKESTVRLFVSTPILAEVRDVLGRPAFQTKYRHLTEALVNEFMQEIVGWAMQIDDAPSAYSLPRDPKDEPYLNLAIATKASFLVSRDRDLLSLMEDKSFTASYPFLRIIEPAAFLTHVRAEISKELGYE